MKHATPPADQTPLPVLDLVEAFIARSGFSAYSVGWHAVRNGRCVDRLRRGMDMTTRNERRLRDWIALNWDRKPDPRGHRARRAAREASQMASASSPGA